MAQEKIIYEVVLNEDGLTILRQLDEILEKIEQDEASIVQTTNLLNETLLDLGTTIDGLEKNGQILSQNYFGDSDNSEESEHERQGYSSHTEARNLALQISDNILPQLESLITGENFVRDGNGSGFLENLNSVLSTVKKGVDDYKTIVDGANMATDLWRNLSGKAAIAVDSVGEHSSIASALVEGLAGVLDLTPEGLLVTAGGLITSLFLVGNNADSARDSISELDVEGARHLEHLSSVARRTDKLFKQSFSDYLAQGMQDKKKLGISGDAASGDLDKFQFYHELTSAQIYEQLESSRSLEDLSKLNAAFEKQYKISIEEASEQGLLKETESNDPNSLFGISGKGITVDKELYDKFAKERALTGEMSFDDKDFSGDYAGSEKDEGINYDLSNIAETRSKTDNNTQVSQFHRNNRISEYSANMINSQVSNVNHKPGSPNPIHVEFHNTYNNIQDSLKDIYSKMVEVLTNAVHDSNIGEAP